MHIVVFIEVSGSINSAESINVQWKETTFLFG